MACDIRNREKAANQHSAIALSGSEAAFRDAVERSALYTGYPTKYCGCRVLLKPSELHEAAEKRLSGFADRQHQIMKLVLAGFPSKNIALISVSANVPLKIIEPRP